MDPQTQQVLNDFSQEIRRLRSQVDSLQRAARTPQLAHSSLEEGQALEVRDESGQVRGRIGWIDGAVGTTTEGGDPVGAPSAPTVTPSIAGLRVTWDGTLADADAAIPVDFDHMAVHVSTSSGFEPSAETYEGNIRRAGDGGMLPVVPLPYVEHYVVLVPVTTGGVQGTPSTEASGTPVQVDGPDLTAGSVTAGTIAAGAVEADKLEAVLTLASTIIAGIPGAARVELDQDGLRGYNTDNELIFAIDAEGNAVFSGDITGSEISGSRITIGTAPGNTGTIEDASGVVRTRVTSSDGQRAQLAANTSQAEFSAWAEPGGAAPVGAMVALADRVVLTLHSASNDSTKPWSEQTSFPGEARTRWSSGSESQILIRALTDYASIYVAPPSATDPDDAQEGGYLYAQRFPSDIAAMLLAGPAWREDTGSEYQRQALVYMEGARPERQYTRITQHARRIRFSGEWDGADYDPTNDGVLDIADTHSILAPRHQPHISELDTPPTWTSPTTGSFVDFTASEWAPITWRTGWSGWVEITITIGGINYRSNSSTLSVGFRLSGGSTVAAALERCALVRSAGVGITGPRNASLVLPMQLAGNADYTLTPAWRLSSWDAASPAIFDEFMPNLITVRNLP